MLNKNVETFLGCDSEYADARIVLFGAPFDSTTSFRPGTRFASRTMRAESYGLETYSPGLDLDMEDASVFDGGDLDLPMGSTELALQGIEDFVRPVIADGKRPFMIGGEHLVSLPVIRALHERYPELHVIHLDAHTDLRDEYLGVRLSHASVMRRAWDILGDGRISQFGIRSGERAEFEWAKAHTNLTKFDFTGLASKLADLMGKPVYVTLDLDVLDPSVFPGTGTPEAGGVTFLELLHALHQIFRLNRIVGCDMVELSPHYDQSGVSTAVALKLLREMLLMMEAPHLQEAVMI
ncbi:agmatinase [Selenomonas sp. TAMA-11512]|uniref:agmatinase n=1 Tax=Selenomonas sp. TAMA-11512 TaxID=3095337 RepID=UPI00308DD3AB|nr:agmatinase [Selenomonas sp. TAMA-11512]